MESKIKQKQDLEKSKLNKQALLNRAERQFLDSQYLNALKIYGLVLKDYPQAKDAKIGVFLSDIGLESDEDAQALFDYYQVLKDTEDDADNLISELMEMIYSTKVVIQDGVADFFEVLELDEGIGYKDFMELIKSKGSFKKAFEDTMFSTKVVIKSKYEFISFIRQLIEAGYQDIALNYLDNLADSFGNDQDVYGLYYLIDDMERK